ncbi:hypothetical protein Patl1_07372 [Pistacia atlantica]|uniref:Uncharacterized protein n=1 Tax=Pistacia atlantica TaxID=434234 RepID=A0ACC1AGU5_9ROSI|nr:hypothetical protein Patl1_07372 [Pistacia atlantica]
MLRLIGADLSYKMEGMDGKNDKNITRVLFCGPYFPPSHNYTKEYLKNYPFIQFSSFVAMGKAVYLYKGCMLENLQ